MRGKYVRYNYVFENYLHGGSRLSSLTQLVKLAGIPVEGKSSECLICMKYWIIILIITIISLGQTFYRIANTSRMHTRSRAYTHARTRVRTHARAHTCTHTAVIVRRTGYRYSVSPNHDGPLRLRQCRSLAIQMNTRMHWRPNSSDILDFRV